MTGQEEMQKARAAGFSDQEIADGIAQEKAMAEKAGFSSADVDAYYGNPPFDSKPVKELVARNLGVDEESSDWASIVGDVTKAKMPNGQVSRMFAPHGPKSAATIAEAIDAGIQMSVSGLVTRGKNPDVVMTEDTPRLGRIVGNIAQLAGDVPAMFGGALVGGTAGPVGAMGGAMALPQGIRRILTDKYSLGEVADFSDFWDRFSGAVIDTAKGYVTGAAAGKVGQILGKGPVGALGPQVPHIVSPTARAAATIAGEATTMATVGSALEGHVPNADDFIDTALVLGFVKGASRGAAKLREIYQRTGTTPAQVAQDAQQDPTILQDLHSENRGMPRAYTDPILDRVAKLNAPPRVERRPTGEYVGVKPTPSITDLAKKTQAAVGTSSKAGAFRDEPYAQQRLHQEGTIVERPITEQGEVQQYAGIAGDTVQLDTRSPHDIFDTEQAPYWYRKVLALPQFVSEEHPQGLAPWKVDESLRYLREHGEPRSRVDKQSGERIVNPVDRAVLDEIVNDQEFIRKVAELPKTVPDAQTERSQYEKSRAFRTAEEILQERNVIRSAEEMVSQEAKPTLREKIYILPKGRGPVLDPQDMAEITEELATKHGIVWGKSGEPVWEENAPVGEAQQRILSKIVQHDPGSERMTLSGIYTSIFDNLNPIHAAVAEKAADTGAKLETGSDPYQLQRLTRGIMGKAREFLKYGAYDFGTYETTTRGYEQILKPVKKDLDGFRAYLAAKRTIEKEAQGIKTGFDITDARAVVEEGAGKYEAVFQERLKYRDALLDYMEKSGILNAADVALMRKANKDYVPFYRVFEEEGKTTRSGSTAEVRNPIKEMKGGDQPIQDPIVSDIKDTFLFIGLAERNAARQKFVALGPEYAEPIRGKSDPVTRKEIQDVVDRYGVDEKAAEVIAGMRPSAFRSGKNELVVFENGERKVYKVQPDIAEAFEDLDRTGANIVSKILLHMPAGLLRAGVTLTPDFMGRNLLRDAIDAFIYAGSHPVKTVMGAKSILTKDTAFHNWLKGGGANSAMVAMDRDYISSHIFSLNAETGIAERALNVVKTPVELLRILSEFAENATRVGAVRSEMLATKEKATIQALSMIAREATVDFARHGRDTQSAAKAIAFFNPSLQGADRFVRAMKDNPFGTTAKALAAVTVPSLVLWWANKDDEEIQNLPRWQHDLFWLARVPLPGGGSAILRYPKAHEIGLLFGTLPERILDKYVADNPKAMKDIDKTVMNMFLPSLVPTAAVPVVEQFANRSMFTGGPLIPSDTEGLLPEYQYNEYTTETAKALGKIFGAFPGMEKKSVTDKEFIGGVARSLTSPALIENYVRQWTGGIGTYALQIMDSALRNQGVIVGPAKPAATLADIPVVKAFVARYPSSNVQPIHDFYDNYYVSKKYYDTAMDLAKRGDPKAEAFMKQHQDDMVQLDDMRATLSGLHKIIQMETVDPSMSPSDKRQLIDTQYMAMIQIAKAGNQYLDKLEAQR